MGSKHSSGDEGQESAVITVKSFYTELEKSAPKLYKKLTTPSESSTKDPIFSSDGFFEALKSESPELYEKVKANGFKFKLDSETEKEWAHKIHDAQHAAEQLKKNYNDLNKK